MYEKIKNLFFEEIKSDDLLNLSENFYEDAREYLKNNDDEKEVERAKYYLRELRKLRIYKALYGDRTNLLEEEREILSLIEDIEYKKEEEVPKTEDLIEENVEDEVVGEDLGFDDTIEESYENFEDGENEEVGEDVSRDIENVNAQPKHINIKKDIDVVRVIHNFPAFTDGDYCYMLKKNDVVALNREIATILEKHNIVKKVNVYENEKKDKKILSIL
ncbi:hypothetical protein [Methanotorris igneus]|uniref:GINS subunit domain-containing protein n=1 Tax=Methanotorris igneus (strain DSM 5666 / JCM 11834 / Kol 5) TaxID=880724 RepID=F6BDH2_METIK|nr:hypothetical protein [Methanotorris igneus]AEF96533.1 hypothetical protein Metig_0991 [Methanotorris igneus Kol 5]